MPNLRQDHLVLYRRVRLKAVVFTLLGLALAFFPSQVGATQRNSALLTNIPMDVIGGIYLLIGLALIVGVYKSKQTYVFARTALLAGAIYNALWMVLFVILISSNPTQGTGWAFVLYGYFTYNTWLVLTDPGWRAIEIIKDYRDDGTAQSVT